MAPNPYTKQYLMTAGPTPVPPAVSQAMATPMLYHRAPAFVELYERVLAKLPKVFQTSNDVLTFAASGSGAMDSAVANLVRPGTKVLILSMYSDEQYVKNALDAGAKGYILKNAIENDLTRAVRAVAAGEQYLAPELSSVLIRAIQTGSFDKSTDPYDRLTQREKQVLQLIAHGKSNKEIAVMLDLSVNTVAVHRANLMSALGVHKTAELVLFAVKKGLVLPE